MGSKRNKSIEHKYKYFFTKSTSKYRYGELYIKSVLFIFLIKHMVHKIMLNIRYQLI
jgi:hypothetical protein